MVRSSLSTGRTAPLDINPRLVGGRGEDVSVGSQPSWCRFPHPQMTGVLHYGEVYETLCTGQRGGHEDGVSITVMQLSLSSAHAGCNCPKPYARFAQNLAIYYYYCDILLLL